jgi:YD repeat-containing protein
MKKLSDKEIKLFQFLDKNVGDEQNKKTAIKYLKDYLGFTPEEILKYYSLWYYSSGGDYETYEYDEEGELLNLISSISTLSSGQIDEIIDDLYDSGKLNKLLGDFFNSNCGGWRSSTPCITFESDGITIELDRENWRDYFSGLGEDDLWMYDNAFSSYSDYYDEVMEDEFDYAYSNDDTIKYLETIAILAGQNSWPGKNNEKFDEGEIKDFLNKTLPSSNVENIIDNYISEVSMELTRARLEAVRYCYNNESKYNTNETRCNSGNYCIFINYEDLKELIIDKNMLNLSELKDAEVNGEIYLNDCYFDAWIDKEGVDSIIRELNSSLERTIEKITEDDELDLEQHIKDRKEFFNMLDKFGFRQYISTTSGGYYKSEDGKIDLHTDKINFKDKKIKFTYEGKTYMVPFEDFPNWFGGSVLDLNESVKIKKKLLKEQKENITKISIFDFDGTLMDTPHPEEGKREWEEFTGKKYPHIGWWGKPESLDDAVFDIQPIESTVSDYKKEMSNPNTLVIMLTGRLPHQSEQIEELLALHNINFDEYHYKSNGDTLTSKINTIKSLLHRYPNVTEIEMWEDREPHVLSFEQWGEDNNINLNVNLVGNRSSNPINENIEPEEKYVNKLSSLLKPPYFYNLKITETPGHLWERILSKIFNQEVTYSDNSTLRFLTVTEPTEWYVDDEDENLIYAEEDSGFWTQMEYDESGKLIHQIDRDHNENRVVPNHPYG